MNYNNLIIILISIIVIAYIFDYFFGVSISHPSIATEIPTENVSTQETISKTEGKVIPIKPILPPQNYIKQQETEQMLNKIKNLFPQGATYDKIKNFLINGCSCNNCPSDIVKKYLSPTCEESIISNYIKPSCQTDIIYNYLKPNCEEQEIIQKYLKPSCETCQNITDLLKNYVNKGCSINKLTNSVKSEKKLDSFSNIDSLENFDSFEDLNDSNIFDNEYTKYNNTNDKYSYFNNFIRENFFFSPTSKYQQIKENFDYYKNIEQNHGIYEKFENINTDILENFENTPTQIIGIPSIKTNKLYFGLPCDYLKDDCFYNALTQEGYKPTTDAEKASLIVPCSYENTENEIEQLDKLLTNNIYGKAVRVFMLNNTDYMVSKIALWKFLKDRYGTKIASTMIPYSVDLTDKNELDDFKRNFDKNKLYITKNNNQRQEGIEIHNNLDTILKSLNKYILVQELLQDPYLINGRKINLRVYCLVIKDTNSNTLVQIYQDGFMYYTPELFEKGNPSFKKNITTGYIDRKVYDENPLTHEDFKKYLDNSNRALTPIEQYFKQTRPNIKLSDYIFTKINHLLKFIFETYINTVGSKTLGVGFQIYGADIAINEHLHPMIMEINKGPDLTAKDGRDKVLKEGMCRDVLKSVGLITPNTNNKFLTVLEVVKMNNQLVEFDNYLK